MFFIARASMLTAVSGWSLGGFLSLAIARILADKANSRFSIAGMLIIDSPWHVPRDRLRSSTVEPELSGFPPLVQKCFENCDVMLEKWELPRWDAPAGGDGDARLATGGRSFNIRPNEFIYKPLDGDWRTETFQQYDHQEISEKPKSPPPAVLIRCVQPVKKATESEDPALIDIWRDEPLLGWERNYPDYIKATIDVDADHYNIFERTQMAKVSATQSCGYALAACDANDRQMKTLTAQLNQGLEILESLNGPKKVPMMEFF